MNKPFANYFLFSKYVRSIEKNISCKLLTFKNLILLLIYRLIRSIKLIYKSYKSILKY